MIGQKSTWTGGFKKMKITLPEGYIFDILSIYQVKIIKSPENNVNYDNFNQLLNEITQQIGNEKTSDIIDSKEYEALCEANLETFDLVDKVKENPCLGKEVDASNYKRFLAKKALQEKWFDNTYSEVKIGYTK
jgi:hypothetical protein